MSNSAGKNVARFTDKRLGSNQILVSHRQEPHKPLLNMLEQGSYRMLSRDAPNATALPDFDFGNRICALYVSLKYHLLHPEYVHQRIALCKSSYSVRVLLCHIDQDGGNNMDTIIELTTRASENGFTSLQCSSLDEVARYITQLKKNSRETAALIKARIEMEYLPRLQVALTKVNGVNKTDVNQLLSEFGSLENIMTQPESTFTNVKGFGAKKAKDLYDCFNEPFLEAKK